ncbi:MAG: exodeoxyribonuclease VII large subunit [Candidatus Nanohalobium sp.]
MKIDPKYLALIFSLIGLVLMYQAAGLEPRTVEINQVDRSMIGEKVTIHGTVENLSTNSNTLFFKLTANNTSITAISFRETLFIREGSKIKASGKITLYQGELEIVVNKAEVLS